MTTAPFILQPTIPAPGEPQRARIVTDPIYSNAAAALAAWEALHGSVPANLVALQMIAAPRWTDPPGPGPGCAASTWSPTAPLPSGVCAHRWSR